MKISESSVAVKFVLAVFGFCISSFPLTIAAAPGDEHWDNQFGPVGANDWVNAVTLYRSNLYVGGYLTAAGNIKAGLVAGFDGTNWFALNNGIPGSGGTFYVSALATDGNNLYVGGNFTNADNSGASYIARWDGANWAAMPGLNAYVFSLKFVGTNLYAGGIFPTGSGTYNCLAQWNGSSWTMISGDFQGGLPVAYTLESDGTNIFVGGVFTGVGVLAATNVVGWNGTVWFALGSSIKSGTVRTLLYQGNKLYAGGAFTNSSGTIFTNTAVWNGGSWSAWANANRTVRDLISDGTNIYAGGEFTIIGGITASRIAKWDGANWSTLGAGVQGFGANAVSAVYKMTFGNNGRLYAAGNFNIMGTTGASHVAVWDGTNWFGLGGGKSKGLTHFTGNVFSFLPVGTNLYVGGVFTEAGDQIVNSIAKWTGTNWSTLGSGLTGTFTTGVSPNVRALALLGSDLYVGGNFTNAGGVLAKGVAHWNGSSWSAMGSSLNGTVNALAIHKGVLFAGGSFTALGDGSGSLHGIAQWNGSDWADVPLIESWRINNSFNTLVSDGVNLYAGGNFFIGWGFSPQHPTTGANIDNLGYWDGTFWWPVGTAPSNTVSALAVSNGVIYAGGTFTGIGGISANRIAKWNGSTWSALGSGIVGSTASATVSAILLRGSDIYIAGTFTNAGGVTGVNTLGLAKWDGAAWSAPLGSGLAGYPFTATAATLASIGNDLYVGGAFIWAGGKPSMFIARWNDQTNFYPTPHLQLINSITLTNRQFRFRLAGTSGESYIIQASTNLNTWTPLLTNTATLYDFTDTNASFPYRFYRAVFGP